MGRYMPNPGSKEAIKRGCTCPVMDNNYGKGFSKDKDGKILYWLTEGCPVHDKKKKVNNEAVVEEECNEGGS